jgi:hypothetical protein
MADTVRLLSTLALKGAVHRLADQYEASTATRIDADFAPTLVGAIPLELQTPAVFSAGRITASGKIDQSNRLLQYLASPKVAAVLRDTGSEP